MEFQEIKPTTDHIIIAFNNINHLLKNIDFNPIIKLLNSISLFINPYITHTININQHNGPDKIIVYNSFFVLIYGHINNPITDHKHIIDNNMFSIYSTTLTSCNLLILDI